MGFSVPNLFEMRRESRSHEHVQSVPTNREHSAGVHGVVVVEGEGVRRGFDGALVDDGLPVVFAVPLELRELEEAVGGRKETDVPNLLGAQRIDVPSTREGREGGEEKESSAMQWAFGMGGGVDQRWSCSSTLTKNAPHVAVEIIENCTHLEVHPIPY